MYIKEFKKKSWHERASKCGHKHRYVRESTYVVLRCDNCGVEFERARGSMDPKRISNNYFHVCKNCDAKVFAQKKGIERKQIWDMPASSALDISKI
jgi:predicted nucleic-acid-binding Zn-ribbon protein|tara:strand:+ start:14739 stop:15026 length:288 start_codon:yes stop_codon:yes gene_type:complete